MVQANYDDMLRRRLVYKDVGVSPGVTGCAVQKSPVRAVQASAPPFQGSLPVCSLFPGLAPWAVLRRPCRAHFPGSEAASARWTQIAVAEKSGLGHP